MKRNIYIITALFIVLSGSGCKKFLDVNHDPNNPLDVQESLLLVPIETAVSTVVAGGSLTVGNYPTIAVANAHILQQLALNQEAPSLETYLMRPNDFDQQFLTLYSTILQNLKILNRKADSSGHYSYGVISKILTAYSLGIVTDMLGDAPYSKAFDGALKVPYDKQEDIYKTMQSLLDSAIKENSLDPGPITPGDDDFIYSGDMSLWEKFAYTLKARYYIHLTKAPGYSAATQSALALTALQNGFLSQSDEANFSLYSSTAGSEGPWFENIDPSAGGVVMASTFIDSLVSRNDPRLPIMVTEGSGGGYLGRVIGTDPDPDPSIYSVINDFYAGVSAPQSIVNYSEALFIKAEAIFRISGAAAANPVYINAINSHMSKLGLDTTSAPVLAYLAERGTLTTGNALQRIIEEKTIANFLSIENFNDWRRTGFPILSPVQNGFVSSIPRRYPYPLAEITANPQPEQSAAITDRVWWDQP